METNPTSGKEGATINILGQDFSSSSLVKFGGTMATSVVFSGTTLMTAKVPVGGLTGPVTVTTGSTTLSSTPFKVLPTLTGFTPPSGTVGTMVTISGTGLKQTTAVKFGNVKAADYLLGKMSWLARYLVSSSYRTKIGC